MSHSFITMEDISLLVFDEAHHAKKDHPYSRLIRSYYLKCPIDSRPRIFGMTASAVDTKGSIAEAAKSLEELLQAKIVTTDDGSLLAFAPKPIDVKWTYPRPRSHFDTDLSQELRSLVYFCKDLRRGFEFSRKASSQLGPWCADRGWQYVMGTLASHSSSIHNNFQNSEAYADMSDEEKTKSINALEDAEMLVRNHTYDAVRSNINFLSPKVLMLHERLTTIYEKDPQTRAIVFVEERLQALVLNDCFQGLKVFGMKCGTLLGIAGGAHESTSVKHQEAMLQNFRDGIINLVFATSVADEGLDIPQCNLCIRFDLCRTTIQYMQSRGRARMKGSIFVHMMEEGNFDQVSEVEYQIENEKFIKRWCSSLPRDRRLGRGTQLAKLLAKDEGGKTFKTDAGAICDNSNSMLILARFAASLKYTGATEKEVYEEEIDTEKNLFRFAIRLPPNDECDIRGCRGEWKMNKQLAKRSAAWSCCFLLRKRSYLNGNLDSVFRKLKPENANARLAVSKKLSQYAMQIKPKAWEKHLGTVPTHLYATIIKFKSTQPLQHPMAPLAILTRFKMPTFPSFAAYIEDGTTVDILSDSITSKLSVTPEQVDLLTAFTLDGVFSDVFNKVYTHQPEQVSYWLVPMACKTFNIRYIEDLVDFAALEVVKLDRVPWKPGTASNLWEDKFICDPFDGRIHYFTKHVAQGVKITDPVPEGVKKLPRKRLGNIIDFSDSTWTKTKQKAIEQKWYDYEQPVLHADLVGTKRNFLDPTVGKNLDPCLIAPQTLQIARIDSKFAASCLLWPAIIHRFESYMIALEAFEKLDLKGVTPELALEAFTKDADNEEEEVQTHTQGKRGMGGNYERLEFIGDSLLKMTTTMTVFIRTNIDEEGMHCRRMEILCNRRLYDVSTSEDLELFKYARTLAFDRATWYPEYLQLVHGRGAKKDGGPVIHPERKQDLGMKTIADMSEAIIGAAVTATRHLPVENGRFDLGIQAITKLVRSEDHDVSSWSEIASQYVPPQWSLLTNDPIARDRARMISAKTGYTFNRPRLLRSAFTHSSDMNSPVPDLQRLEFLGDAVLDWVCISWLFNTNPTRNPQWLTEHKMAMVSNKFLAALAVTLDFDKFVFLSTAKLIGDISTYALKIREALSRSNCPKSFWTEIESPPKALSDLVESYLGAVLVDSNFNYSEIERFFNNHVKHFFENISDYDSFANRQPTTYLHQRLAREFGCQDFEVRDKELTREGAIEHEIVAVVMVHRKVIAEDRGTGARYARSRVCKKVLSAMEGMTREEFRRIYGCCCRLKGE